MYFSKKPFSLHCTVKHLPDSQGYLYHLSNVMTHNYAFTSTVLKYLIAQIIVQHNISQIVFKVWHTLAAKMSKCIVTFYGTSGHGKGLVDAMCSFGVKVPIRRPV